MLKRASLENAFGGACLPHHFGNPKRAGGAVLSRYPSSSSSGKLGKQPNRDLSRWKALYRESASVPGVRGQLATFESKAGQQMEVGRVPIPITGACFGECHRDVKVSVPWG